MSLNANLNQTQNKTFKHFFFYPIQISKVNKAVLDVRELPIFKAINKSHPLSLSQKWNTT